MKFLWTLAISGGLTCSAIFTPALASTTSSVQQLQVLATQGDPQAQNDLGVRLTEGRGIQRNDFDAVRWFHKAALHGLLEAQYNLSVMYANGQGVRQDDEQTVKWSRLAAKRGHPSAQYQLGLLYAVGAGVEQNYVLAYQWLSLAAARLHGVDAEVAIADKMLVASKMTDKQIDDATQWVQEWKPAEDTEIMSASR